MRQIFIPHGRGAPPRRGEIIQTHRAIPFMERAARLITGDFARRALELQRVEAVAPVKGGWLVTFRKLADLSRPARRLPRRTRREAVRGRGSEVRL